MSLTEVMKVTDGIIFIYARWSGAAIQSWRTLTAALASHGLRPRIWIVDADELEPTSAAKWLGELPQGKGETLWMKNGKEIARRAGYQESDAKMLIELSKSLLS